MRCSVVDSVNAVAYAINAIGRDDRHYTVMMLQSGEIVARRYGRSGMGYFNRITIRSSTHPLLRSEEMLRSVASAKGFVAL
jgi:hypothetical protein